MSKGPRVELDDLYDELMRGKIYECSLRDPEERFVLDGLQVGDSIYVDPRPCILETLIHELIHRRKPRLSEKTVTRLAKQLVAEMDEATKIIWWKRYQKVKKKAKPVDLE